MKSKKRASGYTLMELMLVIGILSVIASVIMPKIESVMQKAYQSKSKANLGALRSAISLYYSEQEGVFPLAGYSEGDAFYTSDGLSLGAVLCPRYIAEIPLPRTLDQYGSFNGLSVSFDDEALRFMSMTPPKDVFIVWGEPAYTPLLDAPYAYDNKEGIIYIPNGNYDLSFHYIYNW